MADVYSFDTGRRSLTPEEILENATEDGQDKVMIVSLGNDGAVQVYSSDGITPAELVYMAQAANSMAGQGALYGNNTKHFFEGFVEDGFDE